MNFTNFRALFRRIKNQLNPAHPEVERVLSEFDWDRGSLLKQAALVETITLAAATGAAMTTALPANARVLFAGAYCESAATLTAATSRVLIGTQATPAAFFVSAAGVAWAAGDKFLFPTADTNARPGSVAVGVVIAVGGAALQSGTITGSFKVAVIYEYSDAIQS